MNARGKFVSCHASAKPEKSIGAGRENALPSTACEVVFMDIVTVTYSGTSTVSEQRKRMTMVAQLVVSCPPLPRRVRVVAAASSSARA